MPTKGKKTTRGAPEMYEEVKGRVNLSLTRAGVEGLDALASTFGLSRSELVERIGRGLIPLHPDTIPEAAKEVRAALGKQLRRRSLQMSAP